MELALPISGTPPAASAASSATAVVAGQPRAGAAVFPSMPLGGGWYSGHSPFLSSPLLSSTLNSADNFGLTQVVSSSTESLFDWAMEALRLAERSIQSLLFQAIPHEGGFPQQPLEQPLLPFSPSLTGQLPISQLEKLDIQALLHQAHRNVIGDIAHSIQSSLDSALSVLSLGGGALTADRSSSFDRATSYALASFGLQPPNTAVFPSASRQLVEYQQRSAPNAHAGPAREMYQSEKRSPQKLRNQKQSLSTQLGLLIFGALKRITATWKTLTS